jgi:cytochrome b pre-mRNA-processing protein 3
VRLLDKLFARRDTREAAALYAAVVARAREVHWYDQGRVPDTIDGRFDMIAAVLSIVLLRLEAEPGSEQTGVALTEAFVDDMDSQLREIGIGDVVVGKHLGRMMSMLGGRLGAYRDGLAAGSIDAALVRNLYREQHPGDAALAHVRDGLLTMRANLAATPLDALRGGQLPR